MRSYLLKLFYTLVFSGMLATAASGQQYALVFLNTNTERSEISQKKVDSLQSGHLANIQRLASEEKLIMAGPLEGGGGIFIMNTDSVAQAREWISGDPAIAADRFKIEILPFTIRRGGACLVDASAEFISYTFVRYNSYITKFNVQQAPMLFSRHDEYIKKIVKTGNVIAEGVFANSDGSVMVLKGEVEKDVIMADPAVKNGILQPVIKKIWVGKGSFCED